MAQQVINIGTAANDGTGDPVRSAFTKSNSNFTELYARPTGGSGTVNSGTLNTLAYYASSGTALSPLTLGTGLSVSGSTLNATGGSGSGTVNSGTTNTLAFYAASGTAVSALTLGTNLSITGTTLNAAGGGGLSSIANNNLLANTSGSAAVPVATTVSALLDAALGSAQGDVLYRSGSGWAVLTPGAAGQFLQSGGASANVIWASATGAGTVNSGTTGTLAFYAGSGTAVSPLTLGTNLSITGTTLNAASGGGSSNITVDNTYTAAGAIAITDTRAMINNASAATYTLADGTVDGHPIAVNNFGAGTATLSVAHLNGSAQSLTLIQGAVVNLFWKSSVSSYLYAS